MSDAARRRLEASPRRRVRWVYLLEEWPEGAGYEDHATAILAAPADAVIAALAKDVVRYSDVIQKERTGRRAAEAELGRLTDAAALLLGFADAARERAGTTTRDGP